MKKIYSLERVIKKNKHMFYFSLFFLSLLITLFLVYVYTVDKVSLGNHFFGGNQKLYNINIAEYIYKDALHYDNINNTPSPYAHHQLSRVYFVKGELVRALEEINQELYYYPDHYKSHYIKGLILGFMNREKEGVEEFSLFLKTQPNSWAAHNDKAWLQWRDGDTGGALATIREVGKGYTTNPWIANTFGVMLYNNKQYKEALVVLNRGKVLADRMTLSDWNKGYPGNDPRIYAQGLEEMRASFNKNIELVRAVIGN